MLKRGGKPVDKRGRMTVQTLELTTSSTTSLLEISHSLPVMRFFNSALPQTEVVYTQAKKMVLSLSKDLFYSLSPAPTTTINLNKVFVVLDGFKKLINIFQLNTMKGLSTV